MTSPTMSPSSTATTTTTLKDMVTAFQVDWLAVNQRLRRHPHEARNLLPCSGDADADAEATTTTILHLALQRRRSNYPPLQTIRLLLAIFPQAAWMGAATCASPLHILARHNPQPDYVALVQSARPAVLPQDLQALLSLWDHFVQDFESEQALVDVLLAFPQQQEEQDESDRKAARIYSQLASMLEYTIKFPLRQDIVQQKNFGLHTVAALTADLQLLQLALEVFPHQVNVPSSKNGRLPLHAFLATAADGRPLPVFTTTVDEECNRVRRFRFPFDLLPLLRVLVRACPAALTTRDAAGQLPLHIAIAAGWNEFDVLLSDHPDSLHAVDGESGWMLPFQLAAVSPACGLDTVYKLLRRDPAVLRSSIEGDGGDDNNNKSVDQKAHTPKNDHILDHYPQNCVISNDFMRLACKVGEAECCRLWNSLQVLLTEDHRVASLVQQLHQPEDSLHDLLAAHCPRKGLLQAMTNYYGKYAGDDESLHWASTHDHPEEQDI